MHGGLLWAAFEEWAAHHHSARRSVGLHRHAASEPHRLLLGPVPAAGRPARQRAWPTWPAPQTPEKKLTDTLIRFLRPIQLFPESNLASRKWNHVSDHLRSS